MPGTFNQHSGPVHGSLIQADRIDAVHHLDVHIAAAGSGDGPGVWSVEPPWGRSEHPVRGRDELLGALAELVTGPSGRVVVVHGAGGYGKSAVALHTARGAADRGVTVWWVSAADETALVGGLREVALQAGAAPALTAMAWAGHASAPDLLWRTLRRLPERWLLVIDNADRPELLTAATRSAGAGTGWLRPPMTDHGTVLVTSRDGSRESWGRHCRLERVGALSVDDGTQVLRDLTGDGAGTVQEAAALAARLGGLPLALQAAGSYLAATATGPRLPGLAAPTSFVQYLAHVDEGLGDALDAEPPGRSSARSDRELLTRTWELSLDLLDARGLAAARPLLGLLAGLGPAPVVDDMLHTPTLRRFPPLADLTPETLLAAVHGLLDLGLLDRVTGPGGDGVELHPVVREVIAAGARPGGREVAGHVLLALLEEASADFDPEKPETWRRYQALLPHCTAVVPDDPTELPRRAEPSEPSEPPEPAEPAESSELSGPTILSAGLTPLWQATALVGRVARYSLATGQYRQAVPLFRTAVRACRALFGEHHADTFKAHEFLAEALLEQGARDEALREFRALYETVCGSFGDLHLRALTARYNIAQLTWDRADFTAVIDGQRAACRRWLSLGLPAHTPEVLDARLMLARALGDSGALREAEEEYRAQLALWTRLGGPHHPRTLVTRANLAGVLLDKGDMRAAEAEFRAVYRIRREKLGERHLATRNTRASLSTVYYAMDDFTAALAEADAVLDQEREVLGAEHPRTLRTRARRALILAKAGDRETAEREFQEVLGPLTRALGEHHRDVLIVRDYRAAALVTWGDLAAAETEYRVLIRRFGAGAGMNAADILPPRRGLADVLHRKGDLAGARNEYRSLLLGQRRLLGEERWETRRTRERLDQLDEPVRDPRDR
ncbi:tetratricopeptide repeat protein [Streptomyces odontomachi]|uniref:tetratricopeptide repeat protein n=1 Tax=Streptomyces odontomachi TaxID=2944940 RepID=UPI00210DF806|nr:tetratricopeptide repeat protein [Streptomyces sp. ODS25]